MSLYSELKRRNVIRVAVAYLVVSWLLVEVASAVFPALGISESGVRLLMIICSLGLLPVLVVSWAYELTPDGLMRNAPISRSSAKPLDIYIIFLVVGALAIVAVDFFWLVDGPLEQETLVAESVEPLVDVAPQYPANSIVVLPFVNLSDDVANEYFSDGISEELLNLLAQIPDLLVPSRSSTFAYKDKDVKVADVARDLNARHILEGSVRKSGNRVRISAQLIDARTDTHLWSETYDRTLDDIFAIQDDIAGAVVDSLHLTLLGGVPQAEKVDPEAYALYLQARYLNAQGTVQSFEDSIDLYQKALVIAPDYARAWRGLAVVYMNQANKGLRSESESHDLARQAVDQALAINPQYAMAHATRGVLLMTHDGDMRQAAPHFEHALSLDPDNLVLLSYSSSLLLRLGRLDETIAIREYDVAHDPLDPIGHNNLSFAYLAAERPDEALTAIQTLLMLAPEYSGAKYKMGKALLLKGENDAALKAMQEEPAEVWRLIGLVMAQWAVGETAGSNDALVELIEKHGQDRAYHVAMLLAYCGKVDRAFEWLAKAAGHNATSLTYIAVEPLFKPMHEDPRWLSFLESIGMSPAQLAAIEFEVSLPD